MFYGYLEFFLQRFFYRLEKTLPDVDERMAFLAVEEMGVAERTAYIVALIAAFCAGEEESFDFLLFLEIPQGAVDGGKRGVFSDRFEYIMCAERRCGTLYKVEYALAQR